MRLFILLLLPALLVAAPKHRRDGSNLPEKEREFAEKLSIRQRRIFCGRFNDLQRQEAIKYARGLRKDKCFTPDEAVVKVMEDTGMSLAVKGKQD